MIELGKKQSLTVVKEVDFGVYLGGGTKEDEKVLLPKKQVPEEFGVGDSLEVFVYKDSQDRPIATTAEPKITLGETGILKVKEVTKIGAFLDWGLEKDLLLPFREQTGKVEVDKEYLVALYLDKSSRLCATMKVYPYLKTGAPYQKEDVVEGIVYELSRDFGVFVAVDSCYSGRIPAQEVPKGCSPGEKIVARVTAVKPDGKLDLSIRKKGYLQMDDDAQRVLDEIEQRGGKLPFTDKADPELIKETFSMSKNAFKRAVGRLLKEKKISIGTNEIKKID